MNNAHFGVLFVEDIKREREVFKDFLETKDLKIWTAADIKEAEEILENNSKNIGVIVSDYKMPFDINGLDFLKECSEKYPQTVRILTTAHSEHELAIEALNSGVIYKYMLKPWNEHNLPQEILKALDYFILKNERDFLARERIVTLQKIIFSDTLRNIATLALGLSGHLNNSIAGFKRFISLLSDKLFSQNINISGLELKKIMENAVKKNYMFGELIKHIGNTVVTKSPEFTDFNFADILNETVKDVEIPKELKISLGKIEKSLVNIKGDKQIFVKMFDAVIDYFIDAKITKLAIKTEKAVLFDNIEGVKISFEADARREKARNDIWNALPIIFAVYHHNGRFELSKTKINILLPRNPYSVKGKFDNSTNKIDKFFEQFETIKYYESWLSVIK